MEKMLALGMIISASDQFSSTFNKAKTDIGKLETKIKALGSSVTKASTLMLGIGTAITTGLKGSLNTFQDLSKAQGQISSLGISAQGIDAITKSAREFSSQFAGTTAPEFVAASYDIKSGISSLSDIAVGAFTKIAAMTGAATKSSTAQMTSLFATGYGIYRKQFDGFAKDTIAGYDKLSQEEKDIKFGEYFSGGISSAVQAFKTDGSNMAAALSNLGSNATSAGISFSEQLSILGTLQKTMSGSEAATKYRAFLNGVVGASDKLGLSFTDTNNKMLSMPEILREIKSKYGETLDAIEADELKKAFGSDEAVGLIKQLYSETGTLNNTIKDMDKALQGGTSTTEKMAKAMNQGREFELLSQQIGNLSTLIGRTFAPLALSLSEIIGSVVDKASAWIDENKTLAKWLGNGVAVLGVALSVVGTLGVAIGGFMALFPTIVSGLGMVIGAFKALGVIISVVGRAFLFNPIGLAVSAIALGASLIISNWEPLKAWFSDFFNGLKDKFAWLGDAWNGTKSFFGFGDNEIKNIANTTVPELNTKANKTVEQKNHITVTVNNPTSNVDVSEAIATAMKNDVSLSDDYF